MDSKLKRWAKLGVLGVILASFSLSAPAALATISQLYSTTDQITTGNLIALDDKSSRQVGVADIKNSDRLFGVAVPLSITSDFIAPVDGQVLVATSGSADVIVSDLGGTIKVGDLIAVSQIPGVGQKATGKVRIIGTAQENFDEHSSGVVKRVVVDANGTHNIAIGRISVIIAVGTFSKNDITQVVPGWVQSTSNALAGKSVAPIRVIIAAVILAISLISISILLYATVRSSIISIGRNPLSRGSVLRSLTQVIIVTLVILAVALGAMYLVLTG